MNSESNGMRGYSILVMFLLVVPGLLLPIGTADSTPGPRQSPMYVGIYNPYWQLPESCKLTLIAQVGANLSGPQEGAALEICATAGEIELIGTPLTDSGGNYSFNYTTPAVAGVDPVTVSLTVNATKSGFDNASTTVTYTVFPEPAGKATGLSPWKHAKYSRDYQAPVYYADSHGTITIDRDDTQFEKDIQGENLQVNATLAVTDTYENLTVYYGGINATNETHLLYSEATSYYSPAKNGFVLSETREDDEQTYQHLFGPLEHGNVTRSEGRYFRPVANTYDLPASPSTGDNDTWYNLFLRDTDSYSEREGNMPPGSWYNETAWTYETGHIEVVGSDTLTAFGTDHPVFRYNTTCLVRGYEFDQVLFWSPAHQIELRKEYYQDDVLWFVDTLVEYEGQVEPEWDFWVGFEYPYSELPESEVMGFIATAESNFTGPLAGVGLEIQASDGLLDMENVTTDEEGKYYFNYTAPKVNVTETFDVTLTVVARKGGFFDQFYTIGLKILPVPEGNPEGIPPYYHAKFTREYVSDQYDCNLSFGWWTIDQSNITETVDVFGESLQVNSTRTMGYTNETRILGGDENISAIQSVTTIDLAQYYSAGKKGYVCMKAYSEEGQTYIDKKGNITDEFLTELWQDSYYRPLLYTHQLPQSMSIGDNSTWYNLAFQDTRIPSGTEPEYWNNVTEWVLRTGYVEVIGTHNFSIFNACYTTYLLKAMTDSMEANQYEMAYWCPQLQIEIRHEYYLDDVLQYFEKIVEYDDLVETWLPPPQTEQETLPGGAIVNVTYASSGPGNLSIQAAISPVSNDSQAIGVCVQVTWSGDASELSWVNITISYDDVQLPAGLNEGNLALYYWNTTQNQWVLVPDAVLNTDSNTISANLTHLTIFAVRSKTPIPPPPTTTNLVVGPILDSAGTPVGDAQVSLTVNSTLLTANTDKSGLARFNNVSRDLVGLNATLKVTKSGYNDLTFYGNVTLVGVTPSAGVIPRIIKVPEPENKKGFIPGFELAAFAIALAMGFLVLRRRKK